MLQELQTSVLRCPLCLDVLGKEVSRCPDCLTPHHGSCLLEFGTCSVVGCDCAGLDSAFDGARVDVEAWPDVDPKPHDYAEAGEAWSDHSQHLQSSQGHADLWGAAYIFGVLAKFVLTYMVSWG